MNERRVIGELVRKLGTAEQVAMAIGSTAASVYMWSKLGRIPWKYRFRVRQLAGEVGATLSDDEWAVLSLVPEKQSAI
jgi:hypothetical protein